jgi:hypothetical protein
MTDDRDIVVRLRDHDGNNHRDGLLCVRCSAANEIDRLREDGHAMRAEIQFLNASAR